jgi:hypothetical protein
LDDCGYAGKFLNRRLYSRLTGCGLWGLFVNLALRIINVLLNIPKKLGAELENGVFQNIQIFFISIFNLSNSLPHRIANECIS